jgi:hypothetical protein
MKHQKSCGPRLGKSVHQLPEVVTFAYDLHFRRMIAHWKDLSKDYNSCTKFCYRDIPQKTLFRASKRLQKFRTRKTAKNSKLSKLLESCFELAGKGGWPPISTWIRGVSNHVPSGASYGQPYPGIPNTTWSPQRQQPCPPHGSNVYPPPGSTPYPP